MAAPDSSCKLTALDNKLSVWINVDGSPAPVNGVKSEEKKTSGYIESKDGATFTVSFEDDRTTLDHPYVVRVFVDGTRQNGFTRQDPPSTVTKTFSGRETGPTTEQPFLFGKMTLTEDETQATSNEAVVKNVGAVQVKAWRIENLRDCGAGIYSGGSSVIVHEKDKKAQLSHSTMYGASQGREKKSRSSFDFLDPEETPLLVCEIKYRSRDLLQIQGLVDRVLELFCLVVAVHSLHSRLAVTLALAAAPASEPELQPKSPTPKEELELEDEELSRMRKESEQHARSLESLRAKIAAREAAKTGAGGGEPARKKVKQDPDAIKVKMEKVNVKEEKDAQDRTVLVIDSDSDDDD